MSKKVTREQYVKVRDALSEKYSSGNITEKEYYNGLCRNFATRLKHYQKGAEGFIDWAEENVRVLYTPPGKFAKVPCYLGELSDEAEPLTGRSWKGFWEWQKEAVFRPALVLKEDGSLKHNLLIFCTPRGEGKSFWAVLIQSWKNTCFPDQKIFFCANTKDQSTFAHFSEATKLIVDSPVLLALVGGENNVKQKEIAIRDGKKRVISFITTVSTYTGVLSNCTGFTFSEFFQSPPDAPFFAEILGSTRNVKNAIGIIDSTVSKRDHRLYRLYESKQKGEPGTDTTFFFYESNQEADPSAYHSPANHAEQLASFKANFTPQEYAMYFKNTWDDAQSNLFSDTEIKATEYIGADGQLGKFDSVTEALNEIDRYIKTDREFTDKGLESHGCPELIKKQHDRLIPVSKYLDAITDMTPMVSADQLVELGNILDTDWCIGVGSDRSDPFAKRSGAQSIVACVAKGLPGSRSNPMLYMDDGTGSIQSPRYFYVLVGLYHSILNTPEDVQGIISQWHLEYKGVEAMCSDRYNVEGITGWLIDEQIVRKPEIFHFSGAIQVEVFKMLYQIISKGNFKKPNVNVYGVRGADLVIEQLEHFTQSIEGKKMTFGSDEKCKLNGVQDDAIDAMSLAVYGLRFKGLDDFKSISNNSFFGMYIPPEGM